MSVGMRDTQYLCQYLTVIYIAGGFDTADIHVHSGFETCHCKWYFILFEPGVAFGLTEL